MTDRDAEGKRAALFGMTLKIAREFGMTPEQVAVMFRLANVRKGWAIVNAPKGSTT